MKDVSVHHIQKVLPLYGIPFEIFISYQMADCIQHAESIFKGVSFIKAIESEDFCGLLAHKDFKNRHVIFVEVSDKNNVNNVAVRLATKLSWQLLDELNITCNNKTHYTQSFIVEELFNLISQSINNFLDNSNFNNNIGDL